MRKLQSFVMKCCKIKKIQPRKVCKFCVYFYHLQKYLHTFAAEMCKPNLQILKDLMFSVFYSILQRNFAILLNFMMLFVDVAID